MIQINPLKSYIDGGVRAALTTPPSASLVFDLPGKAIWVKGVKLKGTDHTYTFSHDNYITLTNTPDSNESEDIKIGVNTSALKNAIDTTYGVVSTTTNGLAPKFTSGNKQAAAAATTYYFLGWAGSTLKWYQAPFRNIRINSETTDCLGVNNTDPLIISSGNGISVTWDSTNKKIIITNTKPDVNHNTDTKVAQSVTTQDKNYAIILKGNDSDEGSITTVNFSTYLKFNPSTKKLTINGSKVITTIDTFVGATTSADGSVGLVTKPLIANRLQFLRGDGTWATPIDTWRPVKVEGTEKLGSNALDLSAGNGISIVYNSDTKKIIITNTKPDVNHNTHYTTMLYIGENNDTKANKNVANPYLKLFDDNTRRATFQIKAGNGIAVASDANGNITITNSSPDVNHNTDITVKQTPKTDNVNRPLMMINGDTSTGEQINTSMFSTSIYANASTKMITANGFIKAGSDDSYVLLGGGGHKAVSDFSMAHSHPYLPLAGGTMTGTIKFNGNTSLPQKTLQYVCGIDAFANGGEMGWMSGSEFVTQYAPTKTGIGASGTWNINISGNANSAIVWKRTWERSHDCLVDIPSSETRIYMADSNTVNKPCSGAGFIIGHSWDWGYGGAMIYQDFDGNDGGRLYTNSRQCDGAWQGWNKIAFVKDIPTVTDYYWANIKVSASSSTSTSPTFQECYTNGWFRSIGQGGWYNESYGGGIHMTDSTWVRIYNNKKFYVNNSEYNAIHSAGGVYVAGMVHAYSNYLKSTCNGAYVQIGPQNSSHVHYDTDATVSHWFNKRVDVNGAIWRYGTNYGIDSDGYFYAKGVYANRDGASTYGGVSLYSTSDPITEYGIAFRGTGNYGKIGRVQGDWATYFTMDSSYNRGWIFRSGGINYASISARGEAYFNAVGTDNYIAYPSGGFFSSNGSTGYIIITIPAYYKSCTMMRFNVEIYNYSEGTSTTYTIGGYNYDNGNWYNVFAYANRQGTTGYGNLTVRFGHNGTNSIIWIGESNTSYSYPKVRITNVTLGHSITDYNTWSAGWHVTIATTAPTNVSQAVINPATNYYAQNAGNSDTIDGYHASSLITWKDMVSGRGALTWSEEKSGVTIYSHYTGHGLGSYRAVLACKAPSNSAGLEINAYWCVNPSDSAAANNIYYRVKRDAASDWGPYTKLLQSDGNATITGSYYANSDIRYKSIQTYLLNKVNSIAKLPIFTYYWKDNQHDDKLHIGSSAQAVNEIFPELVTYDEQRDFYNLDYATLGTIAGITACKELVTQKSELQQLKEKVKQLEDKLSKYENTL